jgi:hypothetical protein
MAFNKNGWESNKNLEVMINVTSGQLPKKAASAMVYVEMNPIPPLEMGSEICRDTKRPSKHSNCCNPSLGLATKARSCKVAS